MNLTTPELTIVKRLLINSKIIDHYQAIPGLSFGNDREPLYKALCDCEKLFETLNNVPALPSLEKTLGAVAYKKCLRALCRAADCVNIKDGWPKNKELKNFWMSYVIDNISYYVDEVAISPHFKSYEVGEKACTELAEAAEIEAKSILS